MDTPYALVSVDETRSTQDDARERFDGSPVMVVARRQTSGRGRDGSGWENAPRALAASLAFTPAWPPETWGRLPLVAGLSGLACLSGPLQLKWPNDVVRDGAKLAGILVEASDGLVVAGIGINLWWPNPPEGYGSVFESHPGPDAHLGIAECWARSMLGRLELEPSDWGRDEYRRVCVTLGRTVTWQPEGSGVAEDIGDDGALVVRTPGGMERLTSGAVSVIRSVDPSFDGES